MDLKEQIIKKYLLQDVCNNIIREQANELTTAEGVHKYFNIANECKVSNVILRLTRIIANLPFVAIYKVTTHEGEIKTFISGYSSPIKKYHIFDKQCPSNVVLESQSSDTDMQLMHLAIKATVIYIDKDIEKTAAKLIYYGSDFLNQFMKQDDQ